MKGDLVARRRLHVPVETVVDDIKLTTNKPLEEWLCGPLKGCLPGFKPVQFFGLIFPVFKAVRQRPLKELVVVVKAFRLHVSGDIGVVDNIVRGRENTLFD